MVIRVKAKRRPVIQKALTLAPSALPLGSSTPHSVICTPPRAFALAVLSAWSALPQLTSRCSLCSLQVLLQISPSYWGLLQPPFRKLHYPLCHYTPHLPALCSSVAGTIVQPSTQLTYLGVCFLAPLTRIHSRNFVYFCP